MLRTTVFTAFVGIVLFVADYYFATLKNLPEKWYILIFFFVTAILQHRLMGFGFANNREKFIQFYLTSIVIRFILSLLFVGVFLYMGVSSSNLFVITFIVFYLFYTFFEIYGMMRNLRQNSE